MVPDPVRLFHITAIDNLAHICKANALLSKSAGVARGIAYQNIAHAGAQGACVGKMVPNPPGGTMHEYVPFYFAPRSPMLSAIHNRRVNNCSLLQGDILHFETTVPQVAVLGRGIVFYDRNATLMFSNAYTDLNLLSTTVDWNLLTEHPCLDGYCKYFQNRPAEPKYVDRMEKRQAEFLVRDHVPLASFSKIGVINQATADKVAVILAAAGIKLAVEVKTDWYFLGQ